MPNSGLLPLISCTCRPLGVVVHPLRKNLVERLPGVENRLAVKVVSIMVHFFAQNSLGHFDAFAPDRFCRSTAQLSKILGLHKQSTNQKNIGNLSFDLLHHRHTEIERFHHFGPQTKHLGKRILSGAVDVKSKFVVVKAVEHVVFLIVHCPMVLTDGNVLIIRQIVKNYSFDA